MPEPFQGAVPPDGPRITAAQEPLPRNVKLLSDVSLAQDTGSEMLYPLLPTFVTGTLGAPVVALAVAEGLADALAAGMKLIAGRLADGRIRVALVIAIIPAAISVGLVAFVHETTRRPDPIAAFLELFQKMKAEGLLGVELPAGVENLKLDLRLSVGPIPGLEQPGQGQIGGAAWYMPNTNSREVQAAAWEFLKYLNSPEVQAVWSTTGSNTPAFAATTKQESLQTLWKTTLGGQWQQVGYEVLAGVDAKFPGPLIGPYSESRTAIRKALDQTLLEDQPIKPALDATDAAIDKELELYAQDVGA